VRTALSSKPIGRGAFGNPKQIQRPHPPILIGGRSSATLLRNDQRPAEGAEPDLGTIKPGPHLRLHGHVDAIGFRSFSETREVDLTMKCPVGAPSPTGTGASRSREDALAGWHTARVDPAHAQVAWLASLPDPVVAWAAVPDVEARPSTTRPSLPGAHATIRWSRASTAGQPQASCRAPQRDVLVPMPGRQDEHLATCPHRRWFSSRPRTNRSAVHPPAFPLVGHIVPAQTCPAHLRPTNARADRNRANPANSRSGPLPHIPSCTNGTFVQ
jgi:hypothetical protein